MAEVAEIQFIVESINKVLKTNHTLVSFDELTGPFLLDVLLQVFATLDPKLERTRGPNPSVSPDPAAIHTVLDFLFSVLNYKVPLQQQQEISSLFARGDRTTLYAILYWVLRRMPENAKRVYLAQYLLPIAVPRDLIMQDEGVRDVWDQYNTYREEFKMTHKRLERQKEASGDSVGLRTELQAIQGELEQLRKHCENARQRFETLPSMVHSSEQRGLFLDACRRLRSELEESRRLHEKFDEMNHTLQMTLRKKSEWIGRVADIERDVKDSEESEDATGILRRLRDNVSYNRTLMEETLPQELIERNEEILGVYRLLHDEELDMEALRRESRELDDTLRALNIEMEARMRHPDAEHIAVVKNQCNVVQSKRSAALHELQEYKAQLHALLEEAAEKEQKLARYAEDTATRKGVDVQKLSNTLRAKQHMVKNMKAELAFLQSEILVLQHTENTLRERDSELDRTVEGIERSKGIVGYRKMDEELTRLAQKKNEIDAKKGETLEELSRTVLNLVQEIRERRNLLAPQVLEMRELRQKANEVEELYLSKKENYEYQSSLLEQEVTRIAAEVQQYEEEVRSFESLYHRFHIQHHVLLRNLEQRAQDEEAFLKGTRQLTSGAASYRDLFQRGVEALETRTKDLREKKRYLEGHYKELVGQVQSFRSLRKFFDAKLRAAKVTQRNEALSLEQELAAMNVVGGVDMLVL